MCPLIYFSNKNTIKDEQILIIYSHGNASDLSHVINFSQNVAAEYEVNVLAYDYTGYGLSLGSDINEK